MRFLHTADWQLGMNAAHAGAAAERVRTQRLATGRKVLELAAREGVEFVVIAGDLFEDNAVDRVLIQQTADLLAGAAVPVYIIPGNHDPLLPGSVWEHPAWRAAGNVTIVRKAEPLDVPGGRLYPCPLFEKQSPKDPTAWIQATAKDVIQIGLAHGTVEGMPVEMPDYPIPRDAAERLGLDYLALGHWHSTATYPLAEGTVRQAYSGTPETTKFGERDSGNVLIVEVPAPGATPVVRPVRVGALTWEVMEHELLGTNELARIRQEIEATADPASTLLSLRLRGLLGADDARELAHLRDILCSRFLFASVDDSRLRPSPTDEAWITRLPAGVLREAGGRLRELADPAFAGERPEEGTPVTAARALLELYALAAEDPR